MSFLTGQAIQRLSPNRQSGRWIVPGRGSPLDVLTGLEFETNFDAGDIEIPGLTESFERLTGGPVSFVDHERIWRQVSDRGIADDANVPRFGGLRYVANELAHAQNLTDISWTKTETFGLSIIQNTLSLVFNHDSGLSLGNVLCDSTSVAVQSGRRYMVTCKVSNVTGTVTDGVGIFLGFAGGTVIGTTLTTADLFNTRDGVYSMLFQFATSASVQLQIATQVTSDGVSSFEVSELQIEEVPFGASVLAPAELIPNPGAQRNHRFLDTENGGSYDPVTHFSERLDGSKITSRRGIYIEPTRENLCPRSENMQESATEWQALDGGSAAILSTGVTPNGRQSSSLLTNGGGINSGLESTDPETVTINTLHNYSVFAKAPAANAALEIALRFVGDVTTIEVRFDTSGPVPVFASGAGFAADTVAVDDFGNGWFRISYVFDSLANVAGTLQMVCTNAGSDFIFTMMQLEIGADQTTYTWVSHAAGRMARNKETLSYDFDSATFCPDSGGTVSCEFAKNGNRELTKTPLVAFLDGVGDDDAPIDIDDMLVGITDGNGGRVAVAWMPQRTRVHAVVRWEDTDNTTGVAFEGGLAVGTFTGTPVKRSAATLTIGYANTEGVWANGIVERVRCWSIDKGDAFIQALSKT